MPDEEGKGSESEPNWHKRFQTARSSAAIAGVTALGLQALAEHLARDLRGRPDAFRRATLACEHAVRTVKGLVSGGIGIDEEAEILTEGLNNLKKMLPGIILAATNDGE